MTRFTITMANERQTVFEATFRERSGQLRQIGMQHDHDCLWDAEITEQLIDIAYTTPSHSRHMRIWTTGLSRCELGEQVLNVTVLITIS